MVRIRIRVSTPTPRVRVPASPRLFLPLRSESLLRGASPLRHSPLLEAARSSAEEVVGGGFVSFCRHLLPLSLSVCVLIVCAHCVCSLLCALVRGLAPVIPLYLFIYWQS